MATILSLRGKSPVYGKECFIADTAVLVGDVTMGTHCTVWFHTVIRGDVHSITLGDYTNVQDGAVIHCTYQKAPVVVGSRVSIAHKAIVHGCTIEDDVLIGMGAIVMDHAVIGTGSVIAAGAVVLPGTVVPPGSVYAGVPAKKVKNTNQEMKEVIARTAENYPMYASWYS